jgi:NodT family efflux transporter outer membrane factor (OMF) lipoprotein
MHNKFLMLILLLALGSCKINSVPNLPASVAPPKSFISLSDTTSIGQIPWKDFFADSNLVALIDIALKNNFDLFIAIQRIEMAQANQLEIKGQFLPTVNASGSVGADKFGYYTMTGVGNYDTNLSDNINNNQKAPSPTPDYFLGFKSSWEIGLWGNFKNRKKAARARFLSSQKGKHLIVTSLVAQVARLYYELLTFDTELKIIRENIKLQQTAVETITTLKGGARANELGVKQFVAQLLNTRTLEIKKQQEIIMTENKLNLLLGRFPKDITRSDSINTGNLPVEVKAGFPAEMLFQRPDIQEARYNLEATKADVYVSKTAFLPSLRITAYGGLNSFKSSLLFSTPASIAYGLIGGISAPLINRRQIKANYRRSIAQNLSSFYSYQKSIVNGYQEVVTNLKSIDNLEKISALKKEEVDVRHQAVATSHDLFLAGYASYLEVITVQRSVLEAELGLANIQKEQFLSLVDLYRSLGGGWN